MSEPQTSALLVVKEQDASIVGSGPPCRPVMTR